MRAFAINFSPFHFHKPNFVRPTRPVTCVRFRASSSRYMEPFVIALAILLRRFYIAEPFDPLARQLTDLYEKGTRGEAPSSSSASGLLCGNRRTGTDTERLCKSSWPQMRMTEISCRLRHVSFIPRSEGISDVAALEQPWSKSDMKIHCFVNSDFLEIGK